MLGILGLAASVGFLHTLVGPDHYLPFIVLSGARRWSAAKTAVITALCGAGHVLSSVMLGGIGIAVGATVFRLTSVETVRGEIAAWLLFSFGITYFIWGLHRAIRNRPHRHVHVHGDGKAHEHGHLHADDHAHVHESGSTDLTAWTLFIVFVLGPCEPLIPLLMYPTATSGSWMQVAAVAVVFSAVTVATMTGLVMAAYFGLSLVALRRLERFSHVLAGAAILLAGAVMLFIEKRGPG